MCALGQRWVAHGEVDGLRLTLEARDFPVEDVALERVRDLDAYGSAAGPW